MLNSIATLAATVQILSRDEQISHVAAFQKTGDRRAMDALIRSNIPLAIKVAKKQTGFFRQTCWCSRQWCHGNSSDPNDSSGLWRAQGFYQKPSICERNEQP